jgi:hypothetical protein
MKQHLCEVSLHKTQYFLIPSDVSDVCFAVNGFFWVCNISFNNYWAVLINKGTHYEFRDSALMVIYCHKNYWSLHLHQFFGMIHPEDNYASTLSYMSICIRLWTSGTFYNFSYHKPKCKIWSNPQNKTSPHKKYFTINFIHLRYKVCQILPTFTSQYQSSSLSLSLTHS